VSALHRRGIPGLATRSAVPFAGDLVRPADPTLGQQDPVEQSCARERRRRRAEIIRSASVAGSSKRWRLAYLVSDWRLHCRPFAPGRLCAPRDSRPVGRTKTTAHAATAPSVSARRKRNGTGCGVASWHHQRIEQGYRRICTRAGEHPGTRRGGGADRCPPSACRDNGAHA
jgi:hypothetical protein